MAQSLTNLTALTVETDPNFIWLALRDGDVVAVLDWSPTNAMRTRVYRYNERLPRDMRMKIAAHQIQGTTHYLIAGGLTLSVARSKIRTFIKERLAKDQGND